MATLNINIASASETVEGLIEIATQAETDTGTDDVKALTPLKLEQSDLVQTTIAANTAKVTNVTTNLSEGTTTNTTVDVDSSDGTNATLAAASTSRAGVMTKAKFDEVVVNNAKVSFPEAPNDGTQYARKDLGWEAVASGGNPISDQIFFNVNNVALADSTPYYLGQTTIYAAGITSLCHIPLPAGTLKAVEIVTWTTNTIGAEEATLTLVHAGGSLVLSSTLTFNSRNNFINITGLSETITAGGAYLTLVTPNYATNPGNSQIRTHLKIEV